MKCPECDYTEIKYWDVLSKPRKLRCPQCNTSIGTHSLIYFIFLLSVISPVFILDFFPTCDPLLLDILIILPLLVGGFTGYFLVWVLPLLNKDKMAYKLQEIIFWSIMVFVVVYAFVG